MRYRVTFEDGRTDEVVGPDDIAALKAATELPEVPPIVAARCIDEERDISAESLSWIRMLVDKAFRLHRFGRQPALRT